MWRNVFSIRFLIFFCSFCLIGALVAAVVGWMVLLLLRGLSFKARLINCLKFYWGFLRLSLVCVSTLTASYSFPLLSFQTLILPLHLFLFFSFLIRNSSFFSFLRKSFSIPFYYGAAVYISMKTTTTTIFESQVSTKRKNRKNIQLDCNTRLRNIAA